MSIFTDKAIILKIIKTGDKDVLYKVLSSQYGIITVKKRYSKTEKSLDLGYLLHFEISTKIDRAIHSIHNIKILGEFGAQTPKNFSQMNRFMEALAYCLHNIPEGVPYMHIFHIFEHILTTEKDSPLQLLLAKKKIQALTGNLPEHHNNVQINKILRFIHRSSIKDISKLTGITPELEQLLEQT